MYDKGIPRYTQPGGAGGSIGIFCLGCTEIAETAKERRDKRQDDKKMAQLTGQQVFTYKRGVH
jgi:hypothetical protein